MSKINIAKAEVFHYWFLKSALIQSSLAKVSPSSIHLLVQAKNLEIIPMSLLIFHMQSISPVWSFYKTWTWCFPLFQPLPSCFKHHLLLASYKSFLTSPASALILFPTSPSHLADGRSIFRQCKLDQVTSSLKTTHWLSITIIK